MAKKSSEKKRAAPKEERPTWKGFLKFGLVSIPVKASNARARGRDIELHWLHAPCHSRIHYRKVCPIHGEIPDEEIVSGYQYGKKSYVVIEPEELDKVRTHKSDTIQVIAAVAPEAIDSRYFTDKTYYLLPDGKPGAQAYAV